MRVTREALRWCTIVAAVVAGLGVMSALPHPQRSLCFGHVFVVAGECR